MKITLQIYKFVHKAQSTSKASINKNPQKTKEAERSKKWLEEKAENHVSVKLKRFLNPISIREELDYKNGNFQKKLRNNFLHIILLYPHLFFKILENPYK